MRTPEQCYAAFVAHLNALGTTDTGSRRYSEAVPRQVAMLCAHEAGASYERIGKTFSRDRMNVYRGVIAARARLNGGRYSEEAKKALSAIRGEVT